MAATYGIKLPHKTPQAKVIALVRKNTGLPLSEIKSRAGSDCYIAECDCSDDEGLERIISLYKELGQLGVEARLFWHGEPEKLEVFENILAAHMDTARELGLIEG